MNVSNKTKELDEFSIPSPCDGCSYFDKCADEYLACSDFDVYVETGEIVYENRQPSADIYFSLYRA